MSKDPRIPVTAEQKALIDEAARDEPEGMAARVWAVVLTATKRKRAKGGDERKNPS
jgi:hypothetical protein